MAAGTNTVSRTDGSTGRLAPSRARRLLRTGCLALVGLVLTASAWVAVEFVLLRGGTPAIAGERSIATLEELELGGGPQWVLIRGHDANKPVVLFLHGGPGMPSMYLAHAFQSELERDFVLVHWDRRGAGKSFGAALDGPPLTASSTLADTLELAEILRRRFGHERIHLVGHSWGSYLGLLAVRDRPDLFRSFVGIGQIAGTRAEVDEIRREFVVSAARETGDAALAEQLAQRAVTEDDLFRFGGELRGARSFWPILRTGLFAPEYTLWDALDVKPGADLVARQMQYDVVPRPLEGEIETLAVPTFFFLGRYDYNTPSRLAADYLGRLDAPLEGLVWFEDSAHFPYFEEPERFHREMLRVEESVRTFWAARAEDQAESGT